MASHNDHICLVSQSIEPPFIRIIRRCDGGCKEWDICREFYILFPDNLWDRQMNKIQKNNFSFIHNHPRKRTSGVVTERPNTSKLSVAYSSDIIENNYIYSDNPGQNCWDTVQLKQQSSRRLQIRNKIPPPRVPSISMFYSVKGALGVHSTLYWKDRGDGANASIIGQFRIISNQRQEVASKVHAWGPTDFLPGLQVLVSRCNCHNALLK